MIWFTSDQHFGHTNIIRFCNRPFKDTTEMREALINAHNFVVDDYDEVYHLGDFTFNRDHNEYLHRLKGNHHFIRGNHDHKNFVGNYKSVNDTKMIRWEGHKFWLSHYAHLVWPESHRGAYHVYGHSHGTLATTLGRSMDVGVDNIPGYRPISAKEVVKCLAKVDFKSVDHHLKAFKDCV